MLKYLFIFLSVLLFCQSVMAQKQDTLLYFMKNSGQFVAHKDSADYFLFIMPFTKVDGKILFPVYEYYPNGKIKLTALSKNRIYNALEFDGSCSTFFTNGKRMAVNNYINGYLTGSEIKYYPNGKLYCTDTILNTRSLFISCYDSTGKVMTDNGSGKWVKYDDDFKNVIAEGMVKDSIENGEWVFADANNEKFTVQYNKGTAISSSNQQFLEKQILTSVDQQAKFSTRNGTYSDFLSNNLHYPINSRNNNIQGKVIITFVVEKDGTTSNFRIVKSVSDDLDAESLRVIKLMIFNPAINNGKPVRSYFTIPVNFSIHNE
jgi:TonB family protein